jgi:hypothetical protein
MKRNTSAVLVILGVFLALIALNYFFFVNTEDTEENEQSASRSSYRASPYGTLAFYTLLKESGYPVMRLETPFTELGRRGDVSAVVVIAPPARYNPSMEEFESLIAWVEGGGLLVIIDREIDLGFDELAVKTERPAAPAQVRPLQPTTYVRGIDSVALSDFASRLKVTSPGVTYHMGDDKAAVLADVSLGQGRVLMLTDPYAVANNGIARADNAVLALNFFAVRRQGLIAFDEYHHGFRSSEGGGVMSYFRGTPVPWMMAQAALIAVLLVYTRGRRFTRPLPLPKERRTTNLEFVSSMANITRLARATDLAMQSIYSEFRNRLCRYSGLPMRAETSRLAAAAARRAGMDEKDLASLLARCEAVARGEQTSDSELLSLVTRIREIEARLKL